MHRLSLVAPLAIAAIAAVACGGSTLGGAHDSGAAEGSTYEAGGPQGDAGGQVPEGAPGDAAQASDASAKPGTNRIASGDYLVLWGVTGDGYAVYSTGASNPSFYAVSLAGGAPVTITQASGNGYPYAVVQQNVAFVYTNPDQYYVGPVTGWTSGGGAHQLSSSSYYLTGASSDSSHIAYLDNVSEQSGDAGLEIVGDLYGANADGSGAKLLQAGVSGWYVAGGGGSTSCYTYFSFAGSYAVLFACDASTSTESVWSYPSASWQGTQIVANATSLSGFDNPGTQALVTTSAGLQSVPLGGGAATTIDPTGAAGLYTSDGKNVVYVTTMGALSRSPVANPAPQQLVADGVEGLWAISPDDSSVLLFESYSAQTGLTDLYIASAASPGNATPLVSAQTAMVGGPNSYMAGNAFSADSSHALFWSGVAIPMGQQYFPVLGTLQSGATAAASTPSQLGQNSDAAWALGGSAIAFAANLAMVGNSDPTFDIEWADTSKSAPATTIVKGAIGSSGGASFYVSPSHDRVVYVGSEPPDAGDAGSVLDLYTAPVP
ncbi:MAG TPA: hypothetical protein VF765_01770 [Polyangiaceae bacterium]